MWTCFTNTIIGIRLKFISPLKDQTVKEGQTARFELELSHDSIPVSWFKNDVKIHPSRTVVTHVDGKRHVLEIKDVTLDDICQIKAEAKGVPSMANLTVIGNPRTTTCPVLFCLHLVSPRFYVQNVHVCLFRSKKDFILSFYVVFPHLSSLCAQLFHTCVLRVYWRVTYIVPLSEGDPYFTVKLQDYTAVEKDNVVLDCELSKDVDVMWYHNEAEIKASKTVAIKAEGRRRTLVIRKVGGKDKGQYICDCGTDKTTAELHIEGKDIKVLSRPGCTLPPAPSSNFTPCTLRPSSSPLSI